MAKTNSKTKWVSIGITLVVILASVIASDVWSKADIVALEKADIEIVRDHEKELAIIFSDADDLKVDGCKPAQKASTDVLLLQNNYEQIRDDVGEIRTDQKSFFKEDAKFKQAILEELRK